MQSQPSAEEALKPRGSATSDSGKGARVEPVIEGESSTQVAQRAQREAWEAQAHKKQANPHNKVLLFCLLPEQPRCKFTQFVTAFAKQSQSVTGTEADPRAASTVLLNPR